MKIALIIPTIREDQIREFLSAWLDQIKEASVRVYVVEDNAERTFDLGPAASEGVDHLCWADAPEGMLDCIHVKSPGCRQIGFWKAYHDKCDVLVTLDDDVRPIEGKNTFREFSQTLIEGIPLWVDPLLNYRSRGYPVKETGRVKSSFHVGSFLGVPDVDGETQLRHEKDFKKKPPAYLPRVTVVPEGQLIPVNGGICAWRRELTPYIHYTLWFAELKYRRFDDIWMGVIVKNLLDYSGHRMSYGPPYVNHIRASDAVKNEAYEREGKKWNEEFWAELQKILKDSKVSKNNSLDVNYEIISRCLIKMDNSWARHEGEAMLKWRALFPKVE